MIIWCCIPEINVRVKHQNQQTWLFSEQSYPENLEVKVKLSEVSEVNIGIFNILIFRFFNITWVNIGIFNILIFCYFNITWGEYWSDVLNFLHELLGGVADLPWTDFKKKFTRNKKPTHRRDRNIERSREDWSEACYNWTNLVFPIPSSHYPPKVVRYHFLFHKVNKNVVILERKR